MRRIAVINQKGGVGKTTTTVNLGAAMAQRGASVLLVDLDPQAHLTAHLGIPAADSRPGMYELLTGSATLEQSIRTLNDRVQVAPASIDLAAAEVELAGTIGREVIFRDALDGLDRTFDWMFVDCPPSLGVLTLNALCAVTDVLIPLQPHFLALQGVGKLFETISLVSKRINPTLAVRGLALCMFEQGTRLAAEVIDDVSTFLEAARGTPAPWADARILNTRIRRNIKLAECPSHGQTIFDYAPRSNGAEDYLAMAGELEALCRPTAEPPAEPAPPRLIVHAAPDADGLPPVRASTA